MGLHDRLSRQGDNTNVIALPSGPGRQQAPEPEPKRKLATK